MSRFRDILALHAGASVTRQIAFGDIIGSESWEVDLGRGTIGFGSKTFNIQLLGTEAQGDATWLWSWANEASNFRPALLKSALMTRTFGEREGVSEFTEPTFSLEKASGFQLALAASGIDGRTAYYRAPYDGGALFLLITNPSVPPLQATPDERVPTIITQMLKMVDVDHRAAVTSLLRQLGFRLENGADSLTARRRDSSLTVSFDNAGRLAKLDGTLSQPA